MVKCTKQVLQYLKTIIVLAEMPKSNNKMFFKLNISHVGLYCCVHTQR